MKIVLLYISIILIFISVSSCSEDDPPPLNDFLIGTYKDVYADYQPDTTNNSILLASPTDATYLTINSDRSYKMKLELSTEVTNNIISVVQEGSYILSQTRYVEAQYLTSAGWEGIIEFKPFGGSNWGGEFWIESSTSALFFTNRALINIPNSEGRLLVLYWDR